MSLAHRRNNLARMKARAKKLYPHDTQAKMANHLAGCSCFTCGNPRRHKGHESYAVQRARLQHTSDEG